MKRLCVNHISKVALVALVFSVLDSELPRAVELMTTKMDDVFGSSWRAKLFVQYYVMKCLLLSTSESLCLCLIKI